MFKSLFGKSPKGGAVTSAQPRFETRKNLKLEGLRNWDEISALCGSAFGPDALKAPRFDMSETGRGVELAIALPGVDGSNVDIEIDGGTLTLRAQSTQDQSDQSENTARVSHVSHSYEHRIQLPFDGDGDGAEATIGGDGQLKIFVPRSHGKHTAPTKIEVRSA
ncbi:MAG: Hsp20/alpha crystallin family protein [Alphaproteobacteria bacterium]